MTFKELGLVPGLVQAVEELGYEEPTPIQGLAIPLALEGRDLLGRAQTGTGKTAAFILPLLQKLADGDGLRALVLCPTRELAIQVAEAAKQYARHMKLWVGVVYGGTSVRAEVRDLKAGFDVLVATPGRLIDHLDRGNIKLDELEVLVLDEADRMLDMGFRPQINEILRHCPKDRQTMLFSATLPNGVKSMAYEHLRDPASVEAAPQATTAEGVEQWVYPVEARQKMPLLLELLKKPGMDSVLVFTRTKAGADRVAARLRKENLQVALLHGDRHMKERVRAMDAFKDGSASILVATDVAQRGLDVEGISHVINYDVPRDPDSYVHRVGRTARAGETGDAITFMSAGEIGDVRTIEHHIGRPIPRVELPGYGFGDVTEETISTPTAPVSRASKGRRRLGRRTDGELTPEQLAEILNVG